MILKCSKTTKEILYIMYMLTGQGGALPPWRFTNKLYEPGRGEREIQREKSGIKSERD